MRSDHLAKHIKTHQNKKVIHSSSTVLASVEAARDDTLITAGGTTLILANIHQGSVSGIGTVSTSATSNQDILTNMKYLYSLSQFLEMRQWSKYYTDTYSLWLLLYSSKNNIVPKFLHIF